MKPLRLELPKRRRTRSIYACRATGVSLLGLLCVLARGASAQTTPILPPAAPAPLRTLDLGHETALQSKVTFEARRQPLRQVLAALQTQSGVKLSADDQTDIADLKVTAHIEAMPLARVLKSLTSLYGFEWRKSDGGYAIAAQQGATLDRSLLQLGDPDLLQQNALLESWRARRGTDWLSQIAPFASEATLRSPKGIAFTSVAPELQLRLRRPLELPAASRLLQAYAQATLNRLEAGTLHITVSTSGKTASRVSASAALTKVSLIDSDGKQIAPVITLPAAAPALP